MCTDKAARDLGLREYIPVRQAVLDMAADMLAKGMVPAFKVPVGVKVSEDPLFGARFKKIRRQTRTAQDGAHNAQREQESVE